MIQRYDGYDMEGGDYGDYVKYEDHLAVVEQLEYELRYLREQLAEANEQLAALELAEYSC